MVGFLDFYDSDVTRSSGPRWPGRQAVAGAHAGRRARGCPASPCNMLLPPHPNVKRLQGGIATRRARWGSLQLVAGQLDGRVTVARGGGAPAPGIAWPPPPPYSSVLTS